MALGDVDAKITTLHALPCNMFDGVDDYIEIPHNDAQLGANLANGFTISAWIYPKNLGESNVGEILDKSSAVSGANGWRFYVGATTKIAIQINAGTAASSANISPYFSNWLYVVVVVTSAQLATFYANGVLSGSANQDLVQTIASIATTNAMSIGNRSGATDRTFNGGIKDVKMWNRVLSTTEITEEYNGIHHGDGCIHFFKLNGDYNDYGSVGAAATNSGSIPAVLDDAVSGVIRTQKALMGASGAYIISGTKTIPPQITSIAVQVK